MILEVHSEPPPLHQSDDGVVRIGDSRIPLERVIQSFRRGSTAEQIAQDFDVLSIEDIYAVISYYLRHRSDVETYLAKAKHDVEGTKQTVERDFAPTGIRERLLARRQKDASSQ